MSLFQIFRIEIEKAIQACLAAAEEHRKENNVVEVPFTTIESLVATHIHSLSGEPNKLNVPLFDKKPDWRRHATELVFRRTLLAFARGEQNEETDKKIVDCLDFVLCCSTEEIALLDHVIPMTMIEELLDVYTTSGCEKIFDYIERRKTELTNNLIPGKGKGLVLLRMCNELLRRLSKEINTVFCGRILMFLANTFSFEERSGVNLKGEFNRDMLNFDTEQEVDADLDMTDNEKKFYKTFWSTRVFFANPPSIFVEDNFEKLIEGTNSIVQRFQIIAKREEDTAGARKSEMVGVKRGRTESSVEMMEQDPVKAEELLVEINREFQFPRLLSSRKLLDLEMEDVRFRRNVIVQYLVLFQYLSGQSAEDKDKTREIANIRRTSDKETFFPPNYTLNDVQKKWIDETRDILETLLRSTKPHGNLYTDIILTILKNERHWILWKASGCPLFEKPSISMEELVATSSAKEASRSVPPKKYRYSHGHPEISKLYNSASVSLTEFMQNRPKAPTVVEAIDQSLDYLYDSFASTPIRFQYANGAFLQACRIIYRDHPALLRDVYAAKKKVYEKMRAGLRIEPAEQGNSPQPPALLDFPVNESITEDHVLAEIETLKQTKALVIDSMTIKIDDDHSTENSQNEIDTNANGDVNMEEGEPTSTANDTTTAAATNGAVEVNGTTN